MFDWAPGNLLWATGTISIAILLMVILTKRRHRDYPIFTGWMLQMFLASVLLFFISRGGSEHLYSTIYWITDYIEVLFQIAVAVEFARKALRHQGHWADGTKSAFRVSMLFAVALSLFFTLWVRPVVQHRDPFYLSVDLFTSLLVFAVAVFTVAIAYSCGSIWNKMELYRFSGFFIWTAALALNDSLHSFRWTAQRFSMFQLVGTTVGEIVVLYWTGLLLFLARESAITHQPDIQELSLIFQQRS